MQCWLLEGPLLSGELVRWTGSTKWSVLDAMRTKERQLEVSQAEGQRGEARWTRHTRSESGTEGVCRGSSFASFLSLGSFLHSHVQTVTSWLVSHNLWVSKRKYQFPHDSKWCYCMFLVWRWLMNALNLVQGVLQDEQLKLNSFLIRSLDASFFYYGTRKTWFWFIELCR